ncbi:FGGY-family carbohydrate kinase [Poseidonocella sp. HB161398]|uniref:FGGY-family carbohydrate kinase n=1 Tax=Poseidonocella sp. HB161398 TaxID=2320855 RepID=UPI0014865A26|nr:FGGY-family carbohydrate kinase [Poseidonocella sp. HB161398]
MAAYFCAVDVGTGSARAALFDPEGQMLGRCEAALELHRGSGAEAEYASARIWEAVCRAVSQLVAGTATDPAAIKGLAFGATCSLVLSDREGRPLPLGPDGRDTFAWFDRRAAEEAAACTATGHRLIALQGGRMSPEMQAAKLLWLKRRRPVLWERLGRAEDLADHLTRLATGRAAVSRCALAVKWPWIEGAGGWQEDFLAAAGLAGLRDRLDLPQAGLPAGAVAGRLDQVRADQLGLAPGTPVAAGMIDAFAGILGLRALQPAGGAQLALIAGTSVCVMGLSGHPPEAPCLWGPFADAVLPGLWISEGGLSSGGALLDRVLAAHGRGRSHAEVLARIAVLRARDGAGFGGSRLVLPDFEGGRAPFPEAGGGLGPGTAPEGEGLDALCGLYWRAMTGLALAVRHVSGHMAQAGVAPGRIHATGGLAAAAPFAQLVADATGLELLRPAGPDAVLLGGAIAAAAAAGGGAGALPGLLAQMAPATDSFRPDPAAAALLARNYAAFRRRLERAAVTA